MAQQHFVTALSFTMLRSTLLLLIIFALRITNAVNYTIHDSMAFRVDVPISVTATEAQWEKFMTEWRAGRTDYTSVCDAVMHILKHKNVLYGGVNFACNHESETQASNVSSGRTIVSLYFDQYRLQPKEQNTDMCQGKIAKELMSILNSHLNVNEDPIIQVTYKDEGIKLVKYVLKCDAENLHAIPTSHETRLQVRQLEKDLRKRWLPILLANRTGAKVLQFTSFQSWLGIGYTYLDIYLDVQTARALQQQEDEEWVGNLSSNITRLNRNEEVYVNQLNSLRQVKEDIPVNYDVPIISHACANWSFTQLLGLTVAGPILEENDTVEEGFFYKYDHQNVRSHTNKIVPETLMQQHKILYTIHGNYYKKDQKVSAVWYAAYDTNLSIKDVDRKITALQRLFVENGHGFSGDATISARMENCLTSPNFFTLLEVHITGNPVYDKSLLPSGRGDPKYKALEEYVTKVMERVAYQKKLTGLLATRLDILYFDKQRNPRIHATLIFDVINITMEAMRIHNDLSHLTTTSIIDRYHQVSHDEGFFPFTAGGHVLLNTNVVCGRVASQVPIPGIEADFDVFVTQPMSTSRDSITQQTTPVKEASSDHHTVKPISELSEVEVIPEVTLHNMDTRTNLRRLYHRKPIEGGNGEESVSFIQIPAKSQSLKLNHNYLLVILMPIGFAIWQQYKDR